MLTIPARTVYIDPRVQEQPNCRRRLERLMPNVRCADVRSLDQAALQRVLSSASAGMSRMTSATTRFSSSRRSMRRERTGIITGGTRRLPTAAYASRPWS